MSTGTAGLEVRSGGFLAIAFAALLVVSVVAGPASAGLATSSRAPDSGLPPSAAAGGGLPAADATALSAGQTETTRWNESVPTLSGSVPTDLDGDGRYEDVTGDGALRQDDVSVFFEHAHRDVVRDRPEFFDYSGNGQVNQVDVVRLFEAVVQNDPGHVAARDSDEDGLPDPVEVEITGTDPDDPDSNSTLTAANESANGVLDGEEDFGGDGLAAAVAYEQDLDPLASDTDGDGLPDPIELQHDAYDPRDPDTDGDGTEDAAENLDGDGLSNAAELERGTRLDLADTDDDGLDDAREEELGTDPLVPDSDGDGLSDAEEVDLGTDPLATDTDGDGVPDSEETFEQTVADEDSGATVDVRSEGTSDVTVTDVSDQEINDPPTAGPVVHVENDSAVANATVTLPIDEDDASPDDVAIRKWDPNAKDGWEAVSSTVDAENRTVSAEVESFSTFAVVNRTEWREYVTETITLRDEHLVEDLGVDERNAPRNQSVAPGEVQWAFEDPNDDRVGFRTPTVAGGTVYVGTNGGALYAVDAETGEQEWVFEESFNRISSSLTVAGGTVYVTSYDGTLYAVDAETGEQEWEFEGPSSGFATSPTVDGGTVYVGSYDSTLYAIDAETGEEVWVFEESSEEIAASPTVADGTVYVGSYDSTLYAVDAETGEQEWAFEEPSDLIISSPTVADGTVYFGIYKGPIYAVDAKTGEQEWEFEGPSSGFGTSPTVAGGIVYVGVSSSMYAVNAETGEQVWAFDQSSVNSHTLSPIVASGTVYVALTEDTLYAVNTAHNESSSGSRVELGTLGHVGDRDPLRDSNEDGIPDAVADANPRLPTLALLDFVNDSTARDLLPEDDSTRIDIDPNATDTDGDGLRDAEEIDVFYRTVEEDGETKLKVRVSETTANPSDADTDGDGIDDYREVHAYDDLSQWSRDSDGDGVLDGADPRPSDPRSPEHTDEDLDFFDSASDVPENAVKGAVLGDAGRRLDVDGFGTTAYFAGWLTVSVAPVVDALADTRDCFVPDSSWEGNALDCVGAGISIVASGGTIVGTLSAPSGFGAALAGGGFTLDQVENTGDVVKITATWIRHSPEKAVDAGRVLKRQLPDGADEIVRRVSSRLEDRSDLARGLRRGADQRTLKRAGATDDTAEALAGVLPRLSANADEVADLANRIEDFEDLSGAE